MAYLINGKSLHIDPPIHSIFVNNNRVVYSDNTGEKQVQLQSAIERRNFLNWLVTAEND